MTSSQAWLVRAARNTGSLAKSGDTLVHYLRGPEPGHPSQIGKVDPLWEFFLVTSKCLEGGRGPEGLLAASLCWATSFTLIMCKQNDGCLSSQTPLTL